mgnify:CR=1 FL=1
MKPLRDMTRLEIAAFIGAEFLNRKIDEIRVPTGILKIISPTDCVKDRLAWFYHDNDTECLEQAVFVAEATDIDLAEIKRWSEAEGKSHKFAEIRERLVKKSKRT